MRKQVSIATLITLAMLAGCSHGASVPSAPQNLTSTSAPSSILRPQSVVVNGNFTEYSLPSGVKPSDLTRGPYDTLYFTGPTVFGAAAKLYQMVDSTGAIHVFTVPAPYEDWGSAIFSSDRSVTFFVVDHTVPGDAFYFARVTPEGVFSFTIGPHLEVRQATNLTLAAGNFMFGWCLDPCAGGTDGVVDGISLTANWVPNWVTLGPGGNVYAVATQQQPGVEPDTSVFVLSPFTGAILDQFTLPNGATPSGITTGSDHNLWITAPGINKIIRMTPTGTVTQFSLPTANAGPNRIVAGYDLALYFTETTANKIGRISTSGSVTEYKIPTLNAGATGITPCSSLHCGTHGGVWFTETTVNKIGKFNAPI